MKYAVLLLLRLPFLAVWAVALLVALCATQTAIWSENAWLGVERLLGNPSD